MTLFCGQPLNTRYWVEACRKFITRYHTGCHIEKGLPRRRVLGGRQLSLTLQGSQCRGISVPRKCEEIRSGEMTSLTYEDAVSALNGLQSNASVLQETKKEKKSAEECSLKQMESLLSRININVSDLGQLNVIHISGTKGKGSTAAFCESIMRHCGLKTGFYSSPHLVEVRERIRINGRPLERDKFTKFFFECYDALISSASEHNGHMPAYFRFLTLMAYNVFLKEKLDVAIIEVGIGGAYDCTNVINHPTVCGITKLELDHTRVLGSTIQEIAWHKAGIMKFGVPAITLVQQNEAECVLFQRAKEIFAMLSLAPNLSTYNSDITVDVDYQEANASLALQLCRMWFFQRKDELSQLDLLLSPSEIDSLLSVRPSLLDNSKVLQPFSLPRLFSKGIQNTRWPGRCQTVRRENITFYIDGAHTLGSTQACTNWMRSRQDKDVLLPRDKVFRVLVFYITGDRDQCSFLKILSEIQFDHAVFCPAVLDSDPSVRTSDLTNFNISDDSKNKICIQNYNCWANIQSNVPCMEEEVNSNFHSKNSTGPAENATLFPSVSSAIRWVACGKDKDIGSRDMDAPEVPQRMMEAEHIQVLVTGSLHLAGTVMKFLGPDICEI